MFMSSLFSTVHLIIEQRHKGLVPFFLFAWLLSQSEPVFITIFILKFILVLIDTYA